MIEIFAFGAVAALTLILAAIASFLETRAIAHTAVSTLSQSDYRQPALHRRVTWVLPGLALVALLFLVVFDGSPVAGIAAVVIFGVARFAMLQQTAVAASASAPTRLMEAIRVPEIATATFAFHFSAPDLQTPAHVEIWRDSLDATGQPWFVILREFHQLSAFTVAGMPPAVHIQGDSQLFGCLPETTRAVFYGNNGQTNRAMIAANPQVTHVQLLHGDSDKPPSYSPLTKNYDLIFVAGQMGIDRYAQHGVDIPRDRFRVVGRPQVAAIRSAAPKTDGEPLEICYMPTWRGYFEDTQFSSLNRAAAVIESVRREIPNARITFKPHPLSYKDPLWRKFEHEIRAALSGDDTFAASDASPFDLYNQADLMITDISSVTIDFLYSGKPLLVIQPEGFDPAGAWRYPSLAASYQVTPDLSNLVEKLTSAAGADPMRETRSEVQHNAFGDFGRAPGEAFREACLALLQDNADLPQGRVKEPPHG